MSTSNEFRTRPARYSDQFRTRPARYASLTSQDAVPITQPKQTTQEPEGDSWPALLAKSAAKGLTDMAGFFGNFQKSPQATPETQKIIDQYKDRLSSQDRQLLDSRMPTSPEITNYFTDKTGYDFTPRPSNAAQRIVGNAVEFGVGSLMPVTKVQGIAPLMKQAGVGAGIGAASGSAQEMGVNPLVADIGASLTPYGAKKAMQGISKPIKYLLPTAEETARKSFQRQVGQENIPQVLENLDKKFPFDAPATTAELADNVGIAKMHQAMSPNTPAIYQKQAMADNILQGEINNLSTMNDFAPYNLGEIIRDRLDNKLQNAKAVRSQNADALGKKIDALTQPVSTENTINFLKERSKFAKGLVKKEINYVKSLLKSNNSYSKKNTSLIKDINNKLIEYKNSPAIVAALKAEKDKLKQNLLPGDLRGAERAINKKLRKPQDVDDLEVLIEAKNQIKSDLEKSGIPEVAEFNKAYARDSKPVSAIETNSLLSKFTNKKNRKNQFSEKEISDFVLSPERVPKKILDSSIDETKALMKQIDKNPEMLNAVRSSFIQDLVPKSDSKLVLQ